uniref:Uncharacterized protein n=1 Tax=Oncorhynchus kisutch TaxID=8019 RepID=A0A8C7H0K5_ONCKI
HCITSQLYVDIVALPPSKGCKGEKNTATATKVASMKLKHHAEGDKGLPQVLQGTYEERAGESGCVPNGTVLPIL